jgi:hypothetical protein
LTETIQNETVPLIRRFSKKILATDFKSVTSLKFNGIQNVEFRYWEVTHSNGFNQTFKVLVEEWDVAAAIHDTLTVMWEGINAKTYFNYNRKQLIQMLENMLADREANRQPDWFQITNVSEKRHF